MCGVWCVVCVCVMCTCYVSSQLNDYNHHLHPLLSPPAPPYLLPAITAATVLAYTVGLACLSRTPSTSAFIAPAADVYLFKQRQQGGNAYDTSNSR